MFVSKLCLRPHRMISFLKATITNKMGHFDVAEVSKSIGASMLRVVAIVGAVNSNGGPIQQYFLKMWKYNGQKESW